jgi:exopolyphosphatase/guanosine-5'-triphosphate,3'-diphosphate pyrophosphatase
MSLSTRNEIVTATETKTVAVVDMGSSAIRMVVAEINASGEWKRLDRVAKPIALGKDVFVTGFLSKESMRQAVRILSSFKEVLDTWQVADEDVRVIATSAIREAKNRDTFLDRVYIRTGLKIDIVEGVEENHLTYLAVQHAIGSQRPQFSRANSMIIEVGGGTTEIMLLQRGKMAAAHSLRLGTIRIEQQVQPSWESGQQIAEYLRENIRVTKEILNAEMRLDRIRYFVAVGGDARLAAAEAGRREGTNFRVISRDAFKEFLDQLEQYTLDEIVTNLGVTYNEAEGLVPALLIYELFLEATSADQLIVPDVSIREGVLMRFALGTDQAVEEEFYTQVIASAMNLGKKYHFDESHAVHVSKLALQLFDQFQTDHGMDQHSRMLLEVSAILHDIGNYIRATGHHKHGQYIVANSEIFGLSNSDIRVVANVVRYHRRSMPNNAHTSFISLRREHRILVMKLAAILRVADAMDRGHNQRIRGFTLERRDAEIVLHCDHRGDISVERFGLELKGEMFEEVFGYRVMLV